MLSELQHSQQKRETCDQRTPANLYAKDESHMRTHSTQQRCFRGLTSDGTSNVSKSSSRPIRAERRCVLTQKLKVQLFEAIRQCDLEIIECIAHQKDPAQRKLAILGEMDQREERMTLAEDWNFRYPSCPIALCC